MARKAAPSTSDHKSSLYHIRISSVSAIRAFPTHLTQPKMNIKIRSHLVKITTVTYLTRLCIGIENQAPYVPENSRPGITGGPISSRLSPFARRRLSSQAFHQEPSNFRDRGGSDDQGAAINGYMDSDDHDNIFVRHETLHTWLWTLLKYSVSGRVG